MPLKGQSSSNLNIICLFYPLESVSLTDRYKILQPRISEMSTVLSDKSSFRGVSIGCC